MKNWRIKENSIYGFKGCDFINFKYNLERRKLLFFWFYVKGSDKYDFLIQYAKNIERDEKIRNEIKYYYPDLNSEFNK